MGNGTSSQGGTPPHDKRDVGTSVANGKQHDWQAEQAVAPKQETHSLLEETQKPYSGASNAGPSPPTEKDDGKEVGDLEIDLCASQEFDDVIPGGQEIKEPEDVADATFPADARSDQPASLSDTKSKETQPTKPSLQEVLVDTKRVKQQGCAVNPSTYTGTVIKDDARCSDIDVSMMEMGDISMDENAPTLPLAIIDCPTASEPAPIGTIFQSPSNDRQRPTRTTGRTSQYRDTAFEMQFQPILRRRNCRKIQKRNSAGHGVINVGECQDLGKGENKKNVTTTGSKNATSIASPKIAKTTYIHSGRNTGQKKHFHLEYGRHPHFITNSHPDPTKELQADPQSPKNNQHGKEGEVKSVTLSYLPMNTTDIESSVKTLSTHQKLSLIHI